MKLIKHMISQLVHTYHEHSTVQWNEIPSTKHIFSSATPIHHGNIVMKMGQLHFAAHICMRQENLLSLSCLLASDKIPIIYTNMNKGSNKSPWAHGEIPFHVSVFKLSQNNLEFWCIDCFATIIPPWIS